MFAVDSDSSSRYDSNAAKTEPEKRNQTILGFGTLTIEAAPPTKHKKKLHNDDFIPQKSGNQKL